MTSKFIHQRYTQYNYKQKNLLLNLKNTELININMTNST